MEDGRDWMKKRKEGMSFFFFDETFSLASRKYKNVYFWNFGKSS